MVTAQGPITDIFLRDLDRLLPDHVQGGIAQNNMCGSHDSMREGVQSQAMLPEAMLGQLLQWLSMPTKTDLPSVTRAATALLNSVARHVCRVVPRAVHRRVRRHMILDTRSRRPRCIPSSPAKVSNAGYPQPYRKPILSLAQTQSMPLLSSVLSGCLEPVAAFPACVSSADAVLETTAG